MGQRLSRFIDFTINSQQHSRAHDELPSKTLIDSLDAFVSLLSNSKDGFNSLALITETFYIG